MDVQPPPRLLRVNILTSM